jgi:UDP-N-acetylglucosamine 2-epimerase (non-hydrolysing)
LREFRDTAVVWPVHANKLVANDVATGMAALDPSAAVRLLLTAPLDYPSLIATLRRCWLALTDSGGIQEEAVSLGVPIFVLRETTERPEILASGYGRLVGTAPETITQAFSELTLTPMVHASMRCRPGASPFGDGQAATRIGTVLMERV